MNEELEKERGGSRLRYSFDIRQDKEWREIGVDAKTGHVLENISESASPRISLDFRKRLRGALRLERFLVSPVNCQA